MGWGLRPQETATLQARAEQTREAEIHDGLHYAPFRPTEPGTIPATPKQSIALPTVYACVELIANVVCSMPLRAEKGGEPVTLPEWLRRPSGGFDSQRALVEHLVISQALHGAGYLWAESTGRLGWNVWPVDPAAVYVDAFRRTTDQRADLEYRLNGATVPLARWWDTRPNQAGLVVVNHRTLPGVPAGVGPIQAARATLGGYIATDAYGADVFASGVPQGTLSTEQDITEATATRYSEKWAAGSGQPVRVLGAGLTFEALRLSPKDAAWLEAREWNASDIARMYLVPASRLGLPTGDGLTYATARDNEAMFLRQCGSGYTGPIEAALDRLTPPGSGATNETSIRFEWDAYLRPTVADRAQLAIDLVGAGLMTVDEGRAAIGLGQSEVPA